MTDTLHHPAAPHVGTYDRNLATPTRSALEEVGRAMFTGGALPNKTKQLIAVAVAHVTQCPDCIDGHTELAGRAGATPQEMTEAIWVATEIHAGGTFAHPTPAAPFQPNSTRRCPQHDWSH